MSGYPTPSKSEIMAKDAAHRGIGIPANPNTSEIEGIINRLTNRSLGIYDRIVSLEARLDPILSQPEKAEIGGDMRGVPTTTLGHRLVEIEDVLGKIERALISASDRIQL